MEIENTFSAQIMRIINKLIFLEKKSIFEFQGIKLYPSEIHLMQVIETDNHLNATDMAKALGVTKGAVSQTLSRLVKKGIAHKTKDPYQKNKLTVDFTKMGKAAMKHHQQKNQSLQEEYENYLSTVSESNKKIIRRFLADVEQFVDMLG